MARSGLRGNGQHLGKNLGDGILSLDERGLVVVAAPLAAPLAGDGVEGDVGGDVHHGGVGGSAAKSNPLVGGLEGARGGEGRGGGGEGLSRGGTKGDSEDGPEGGAVREDALRPRGRRGKNGGVGMEAGRAISKRSPQRSPPGRTPPPGKRVTQFSFSGCPLRAALSTTVTFIAAMISVLT